jgi:CRP-like cAMP-binding protein
MSVIPQDDIQNVWQKVSAQKMECEAGDPIIKEGENATDIYYVVHGSVHIFKEDPSLHYNKAFKEVTLAVGGVFGELELMCVDATRGPRNVGMTAVATSKTSLMR